ncbi:MULTISPECIES: hypothetical protein [Brevibacillus]|uniref:hypothetical protein n=1 Tax=Brevibacillus TaxID=55080 RepID=UPI0004F261C2|nr:hypothetical protein [Brevibacillus borstelensis]KKX53265.1 hypothetical protein X546_20525 [Brevibacillus borstelensis cifa_chp40]
MSGEQATLTREKYLELKDRGLNDEMIGKKFGLNRSRMTRWKKQHDLIGERLGTNPSFHVAIAPPEPGVHRNFQPKEDSVVAMLREALQEKNQRIRELEALLHRANGAAKEADAKAERFEELLKLNGIEIS